MKNANGGELQNAQDAFIGSTSDEYINLEREKYVKLFVSDNLTPRGEFEKTSQYEERCEKIVSLANEKFDKKLLDEKFKYEETYNNIDEIRKNRKELSLIYLEALGLENVFSLGRYDADNETFPIVGENSTYEIQVPIDIAPDFKNSFSGELPIEITNTEIEYNNGTYCVTWTFTLPFKDKIYFWSHRKNIDFEDVK